MIWVCGRLNFLAVSQFQVGYSYNRGHRCESRAYENEDWESPTCLKRRRLQEHPYCKSEFNVVEAITEEWPKRNNEEKR